ncbi:uncharacterized protein CLUP02_02760 [Colletotrichum lupini]|uniref:Uncharacterized protein n=1 Tax=Colletotrichum lupini TaxID=145971 RepID=A0A9Q8SHM4_9PEZI|nr:uncharacterized protein CLUP02_02760 [Colletotrichum lupini]UQC77293.1 hypothetical protein CLUP02_02760 [Colletotrichum lupini]
MSAIHLQLTRKPEEALARSVVNSSIVITFEWPFSFAAPIRWFVQSRPSQAVDELERDPITVHWLVVESRLLKYVAVMLADSLISSRKSPKHDLANSRILGYLSQSSDDSTKWETQDSRDKTGHATFRQQTQAAASIPSAPLTHKQILGQHPKTIAARQSEWPEGKEPGSNLERSNDNPGLTPPETLK